uniref:Triacylglycerol lipase n=1 Tax=Kwoniella dejecticola CBS 10117 TaxID=1296121 RepID=A0A1A6A9H7_9TREE|nr:triacylglycerol lipase [Kwoniella dejecticola CBS 10117]OBR86717.1 triacylglycerol lipase [Kwoniella dejecticola CBS 10117]
MSHQHDSKSGHPHQAHRHSSSTSHTQHQHHHHRSQHGDVEDAHARRRSKGKERAIDVHHATGTPDEPLSAMLDEALNTSISPPHSPASLPSSVDSTFDGKASLITEPPLAHHHAPMRPVPSRLLSQLTRSTLPISSLAYGDSQRQNHRSLSFGGVSAEAGPSTTRSWRSNATVALTDEPFPDLDPTTGLPLNESRRRSGSTSSEAPSLHLQRTITGLLETPPKRKSTESSLLPTIPVLSNINLSLPRVSLPSAPSLDFAKRGMSTSGTQEDWSSWASGWWNGNKGKVDEMMSEEDRADTVEEEQEKLRKKYKSPQNPVVFCHGLLGFDYLGEHFPLLQISHWRGIREVLESNGTEVLIARVPATSSIKDRAKKLEEVISEKFPGREVNLIGHSMGGLDCRYLISELRPKAFRPISLTTISTPHRGSPFADYVIDNVIGRDRLPTMLSLIENLGLPHTGDGTAFSALGTHSMKEFNAQVLDKEDVNYYSWGASTEPGFFDTFRWPHSVILAKEGPNDGLVSVHSAMWGEYRGTLVGVNHLDLVGWVNTVKYTLAGWTGKPIAFKPATFYLEVADYLAEQGF